MSTEINFLTRLESNPVLKGVPNKGLSDLEISNLESQVGDNYKFPAVWKEYLFLCGEKSQIQLDMPYEDFAAMQQEFHEILKFMGTELTRPVYVIDSLLGFEGATFFYLDEQVDNPEIWHSRPYSDKGETFQDTIVQCKPPTLHEYLEFLLDLAIEGKTL